MNRIESLKEVKEKLEELSEYLQETDKDHPMQKADPYWDTKCFHALVNTADEAIEWVARELREEEENEMFRENESLPDDGIRTGALLGQ
jgi:hypothetical protein